MNQPFVPNLTATNFKKYRRRFKQGKEVRRVTPLLYKYGISSIENAKVFSKHLEMMRKTITNAHERKTKVLFRITPTMSQTHKGHDIRRGRGKGAIQEWFAFLRVNRIVTEFESFSLEKALAVTKIVGSKLPFKVKLVINENYSIEKVNILSKKRSK